MIPEWLGAGIGKSTLLGLINGGLEATKGTITRNPRVRLATFSQHHVEGMDLALTPLQYMLKVFPGTNSQEMRWVHQVPYLASPSHHEIWKHCQSTTKAHAQILKNSKSDLHCIAMMGKACPAVIHSTTS